MAGQGYNFGKGERAKQLAEAIRRQERKNLLRDYANRIAECEAADDEAAMRSVACAMKLPMDKIRRLQRQLERQLGVEA